MVDYFTKILLTLILVIISVGLIVLLAYILISAYASGAHVIGR